MKRLFSAFYLGILLSCLLSVVAQAQIAQVMPGLADKRGSDHMPPAMLSERTAVLISADGGNWQDWAGLLHPVLQRNGIDAVAYFMLEEVMAGPDAQKEMLPMLVQRQFGNVAILGRSSSRAELFLMEFQNGPSLVKMDGAVWHTEFTDIESLEEKLKSAFSQSSVRAENFLIPDFPEFFRAASVPANKRFESFNPDVKLDNLAVRYFPKSDPDSDRKNARLEELMKEYSFKYELVNTEISEDVLRRNGFQWILGYLRAPEANLKEILGYRNVPQNGGGMVYKFYYRQLYAQEIYLGNTWDAQPNWETALQNFIRNTRQNVR
jgi:hypothetical protein